MRIFLLALAACSVALCEGAAPRPPAWPQPKRLKAKLVETHAFRGRGAASQGLALGKEFYYGANSRTLCRFDKKWDLIETKPLRIEGVNHLGAIDYHDGYLWGGFLRGPEKGKHDPKLNRGIVAKIRASDLAIVQTWDLTHQVKWIDPVCFDGRHLWVGDLSDLGIHRYRFTRDGRLVRDGILRYPRELHFSQGIRVVGDRLYSIHTFGSMEGLFEFVIPEKLSDAPCHPIRSWNIRRTGMHLEGFDFVPGRPNQLWEAQGNHVDRYELEGLPNAPTHLPR
jgi:hypothetical protein